MRRARLDWRRRCKFLWVVVRDLAVHVVSASSAYYLRSVSFCRLSLACIVALGFLIAIMFLRSAPRPVASQNTVSSRDAVPSVVCMFGDAFPSASEHEKHSESDPLSMQSIHELATARLDSTAADRRLPGQSRTGDDERP